VTSSWFFIRQVVAELQSNDDMKSSVPLTRWEVWSGTGEDEFFLLDIRNNFTQTRQYTV